MGGTYVPSRSWIPPATAVRARKTVRTIKMTRMDFVSAFIASLRRDLFKLREGSQQQDEHAANSHEFCVQPEAGNGLRHTGVRTHQRADAQDGVEDKSQTDHGDDQNVLDEHGN